MTEAVFDFAAIARINRRESAVSKVDVTGSVGTINPDRGFFIFGPAMSSEQYSNWLNALNSDLASMGQQAGNVGQPETA